MPRRFLLAALLVLIAHVVLAQDAQPGADSIGDPLFPPLGNGGYDVQHYALDLDVDVDFNRLDAVVTIDALATQALSAFNLDFLGFDIASITVNGKDAHFTRRERELTITPEAPLAEGEAFTVVVAYAGEPGTASDSLPSFSDGWMNYGDGVFVASEPTGAARWFPSNDHPLDKATYTFRVTVDDRYVVAANGLLQDVLEADGRVTYVWETEHVMASYLATVNIAEFAVEELEGPDGLPIRNYFPANIAEEASQMFAVQVEMLDYFDDLFGPYPFEAYGVVVADTNLTFALETQTLSLFGRNIVSNSPFAVGSEDVIAHELAHQWFGDSVSLRSWRDLWLKEGFATYAQALWIEHLQGKDGLNDYMDAVYSIISRASFSPQDIVVPGDPPADDLYDNSVYMRGAWTLHALRIEIGDQAFFDTLRTYHDRFRYGNASTDDFIAVAEEVSEQELDDLFDAWLYDPQVPDVPERGLFAERAA